MEKHSRQEFDLTLAKECANSFSRSTGVGCAVSALDGEILHQAGYSCNDCTLCRIAGKDESACVQAHIYGTREAERFGGRYIYYCPMGLTCFSSPILGELQSAAKIIAGPLLMGDKDDFLTFDLEPKLTAKKLGEAAQELDRIPHIEPGRVNALSSLLFMSVGFLNDVSSSALMLETQNAGQVQGYITSYIQNLKDGGPYTHCYPYEQERELLQAIAASDKPLAQKLLNDLLGHIFFSTGGDLEHIKSRVYELLVLMSRSAIQGGADPGYGLSQTRHYLDEIGRIGDVDTLCIWLTREMNRFTDSVLQVSDARHADVLYKAVQYLREHYTEKVTLDEVAQLVYLSPSYFSKVFKAGMGCNFNTYVNRLRIERSKVLLQRDDFRLADISMMVGFEDQSYFTKVFKRVTGISPNRYRETRGRNPAATEK